MDIIKSLDLLNHIYRTDNLSGLEKLFDSHLTYYFKPYLVNLLLAKIQCFSTSRQSEGLRKIHY